MSTYGLAGFAPTCLRVASTPLLQMIVEPEQRVADFAKAGADIISVHVESKATTHLDRVVHQVPYHQKREPAKVLKRHLQIRRKTQQKDRWAVEGHPPLTFTASSTGVGPGDRERSAFSSLCPGERPHHEVPLLKFYPSAREAVTGWTVSRG